MARSFLFLLASSRSDGNSELLARTAAEQLPADTSTRWLDLTRLDLPDHHDERHADGPASAVRGDEALLRAATLAATDLVIVSPLYWYSVSAQVKRYLDYWSKWLANPDRGFRPAMAGHTLWGVTAMAHREEEVAEPLVLTLHHTAAYLGMRFGGVLLGNGTRPGQVRADEQAMIRAKTFFAQDAPPVRFAHQDQDQGVFQKSRLPAARRPARRSAALSSPLVTPSQGAPPPCGSSALNAARSAEDL